MVRVVDQDEEYGVVGLGRFALSAADVFSVVSIDDIIEPTLIYDIDVTKNKIETALREILVWDVREYLPVLLDDAPVSSQEDDVVGARGGVTRDNSLDKTGYANTEDLSRPHGGKQIVAGAASGALNVTTGSAVPACDAYWSYFKNLNQQVDGTGQINQNQRIVPENPVKFGAYEQNPTRHHMLLHANYYQWLITDNFAAIVADQCLGMDARLMSIDLEEVLADRGFMLNLANVLTILTI